MTICIYHKGCLDGFAAAWVIRKALLDDIETFRIREKCLSK
jgi:hypothetical protein